MIIIREVGFKARVIKKAEPIGSWKEKNNSYSLDDIAGLYILQGYTL
jgi:hypothetical protein